MSASVIELGAMRRAIALSALGPSSTSPNPPVGCVILDSSGQPVGEGYHQRKGEPHAEVRALAAANGHATGGTALVTLEPCNHHGRTPPCHQALIDSGIARVLIAVIDPTSRGVGGAARLRDAGIEIHLGVLADEARVVLGPWLTPLDAGRPTVAWVFDATDGLQRKADDDLVAQAGLRYQVDAVVHADGHVDEGLVGEHGPRAFKLPRLVPVDDPVLALSLLQAGRCAHRTPARRAQPGRPVRRPSPHRRIDDVLDRSHDVARAARRRASRDQLGRFHDPIS